MKTLKANNFDQAIKEVESLDKDQAKKVKEEIKFADRKHNHIIVVKILDRPGEAKNEVTVNTIVINDDKLAKFKKNFKFLGYAKLIILHDASQVKEDQSPVLHLHDEQAIEAKVKSQLEAKHKAEMEALRAKLKKEALEGIKQTEETETTIPDPTTIPDTVEAMKEFAKQNEIDLSGLKLKDKIKATLLTWYNEQIAEANQ